MQSIFCTEYSVGGILAALRHSDWSQKMKWKGTKKFPLGVEGSLDGLVKSRSMASC